MSGLLSASSTDKQVPLIGILGPTAAGKSGLAEYLARHLDGEIISSDASAVYEELSVGVTKPDPKTRELIPHHLLDVTTLERGFHLMEYLELANQAILDIDERGRVPLLVGGSSLYARALLDGYIPPQIEIPEAVRAEVRSLSHGVALERLEAIDKEAYQRIDQKNPRRVTRALELAVANGGPVSPPRRTPREDLRILRFYLIPHREIQEERITRRAHEMWEGWVEEVDRLEKKGLHRWLEVRRPIGYDSILAFRRGEVGKRDALETIIRQTCKLAKKQRTWLRREEETLQSHHFHLQHQEDWARLPETAVRLAKEFLGRGPDH